MEFMSRYRPVISIRTDLAAPTAVTGASSGDPIHDAVADRVAAYSITPRTLKSVTEFDPAYIAASAGAAASVPGASAYNPELYTSIEVYNSKGNSVTRYAIRYDIIDSSTGDVLGQGTVVDKGSTVTSSKYKKSNAKVAILHDLEKDILIKAITSFVTPSTSGMQPTTAIVDIFERNDGISINRDLTTGHPIYST